MASVAPRVVTLPAAFVDVTTVLASSSPALESSATLDVRSVEELNAFSACAVTSRTETARGMPDMREAEDG